MQTLSKGFKLPESGDLGSVWFAALGDNITQMNSHDHDGTDSEKVRAVNLVTTGSTATVASGSFADQGDGYWRATVTVPAATVQNYSITFRDPTTREPIYLRMARLSDTQFYVYTSYVQDIEVVYGV